MPVAHLGQYSTSADLIQHESKRLYRLVNSLGDDHDDTLDDSAARHLHAETFHQTHECRLSQPPLALMDAMAQAGPTPWKGIPAILGYEATQPLSHVPTLLLRGEYDFCTEECMQGWYKLVQNPSPTSLTLSDCSHYGMLEDEQQYGKAITRFLQQKHEI